MTLSEVCEPIFQHACRVHRGARKGVSPAAAQVRAEVKGLFEAARDRAAADPQTADQFAKVEIVLLYFVDSVIRGSALPYAARWEGLAAERGHNAGDEDFFDQLDATLADRSEAATQRLVIFYTCLGLGFAGWYRGQPEFLRGKMNEIIPRVQGAMDADRTARVTPEAYEGVNTTDLIEPAGRGLVGVGIVLAGLAATVFLANLVLYREKRAELTRSLEEIVRACDPEAGGGGR